MAAEQTSRRGTFKVAAAVAERLLGGDGGGCSSLAISLFGPIFGGAIILGHDKRQARATSYKLGGLFRLFLRSTEERDNRQSQG